MTDELGLTARQRERLEAIIARRDALIPRLTPWDDLKGLGAVVEIVEDDTKSPDQMLDALDEHVTRLELEVDTRRGRS